jgi:hypothetical protein
VIETVGLVALYLSLHHAGSDASSWDVIPALAFGGIGMGMVFVPLFDIILGGVREHEVGSASGVLAAAPPAVPAPAPAEPELLAA